MRSPPLGELYDLLRAEGFAIGVDDHVRIGRLLERAAPWTEASLHVAVRSLVAKDLRERALFDQVWTRWQSTAAPAPAPTPPPAPPRRPRHLIAFIVIVAHVIAVIAILLIIRRGSGGSRTAAVQRTATDAAAVQRTATDAVAVQRTATDAVAVQRTATDAVAVQRTATDAGRISADAAPVAEVRPDAGPAVAAPDAGPVAVAEAEAEAAPEPEPVADDPGISAATALVLGGGGVIALALGLGVAATLARRRRAFVPGPWTYRRVIPEATAATLDREDVEDGAAHLTWQPLAEGGADLDIDRTVHRTLEAGGLPSFAYRPPPPAPEYLVLEDLAGGAERWRPLFDELLRGLAREGVRMQRFTFFGSPELCTPAGGGAVSSLRDLAEHGDALIVIGDGAEAIDPDTGKPSAWLETLRHVPRRLWINPLPPARWSEAARLIGEQTAMEHGVAHALAALHAGVDRRDPPTHAYPKVIERAPGSDAGIDALRTHLGGAAFRALALTAAAGDATGPAMRWVAQRFSIGLDEGAWLRLVSLPWLAERKWPAGLRERLIRELPPEASPDADRALAEVLAASEPRAGSAAHLRWQLDRAGASADPSAAMSALSGLATTPLHAEAARKLQVAGVPDLRRRAALALAALGLGLTALAAARWTWRSAPRASVAASAPAVVDDVTGLRRLSIDRVEVTGDEVRAYVDAIDLATGGQVIDVPAWTTPGLTWTAQRFADAPAPLDVVVVVQSGTLEQLDDDEVALDRLFAALKGLHARIGLVKYDETGVDSRNLDPGADLEFLVGEMRVSDVIGDVELGVAVDRALHMLTDPTPRRRLMVVIGDGRSRGGEPPIVALGARVAAAGVRVDTIAFSPDDARRPMFALGELSDRTHGTFRWVRSAAGLGTVTDALIAELRGQYVLSARATAPLPAVLEVRAGSLRATAPVTFTGDAPSRPSNRAPWILRRVGVVLCALGLALLLHVAWVRARFGRLGLRLVAGYQPARLPRAFVVAGIVVAAAVAGGVAGALLWRTIAPPSAASAARAPVSPWPAIAHDTDLRVEPAPPGVDRAPEIVVRVTRDEPVPALEALRLVEANPGAEMIEVPASAIIPYVEGDEPLGVAVVVEAMPDWLDDARAVGVASVISTLAAAGPPGSRGAIVTYRDRAIAQAPPGPGFTLTDHRGEVTGASFSADGARILTSGTDGTAWLWDAATGKSIALLQGATDAITAAAFSPDDARVAVASADGTVRVWADPGERAGRARARRPGRGPGLPRRR